VHILQVPKPFGAFFAEDNLKTMVVQRNPPAEPKAEALEAMNEEAHRQGLMNVDAADDQADAGDDDDAAMDADDGGGDD
jgi:senataxin